MTGHVSQLHDKNVLGIEIMTGKRILITGVTGMMGRAMARTLVSGNTVYGVARFSDPELRSRLEHLGVECIPCDLHDQDLSCLPANVDTLLHFAVSYDNDAATMAFNGFLVGRLLSHLTRLEQYVVSSSVAVYRGASRYDISEQSPTIPNGIYGTTKLAGDVLATHISRERRLPGAILRYWFPYTDEPDVSSDYFQGLLQRLREGKTFVVPDDDTVCQQPLFIDDLVRITVDALDFVSDEPFVLNVAGHKRLPLMQVISTLAEVFELEPQIRVAPTDACNLLHGSYDLTRLAETCGLGTVGFREGQVRLKKAMQDLP